MIANAKRANASDEYVAVTSIPITDQIMRELLPATCRRQLVGELLRRWVCCDAQPEDLSPAMPDNQQPIEQAERDRRDRNRSIAAIPSAWLRRNVFQPCDGGPLLRAIYLATLVCPMSIPSLSSSPWIRGAPHNGLASSSPGLTVGSQLAPLDGPDDARTSSAKTIRSLHGATEPRYRVERWRARRGPSETGGRPNPERPCRQPGMASDSGCLVAAR